MEITVLENCEELTFDSNILPKVANMVYLCEECGLYHVKNEYTLDDVENAVKEATAQ